MWTYAARAIPAGEAKLNTLNFPVTSPHTLLTKRTNQNQGVTSREEAEDGAAPRPPHLGGVGSQSALPKTARQQGRALLCLGSEVGSVTHTALPGQGAHRGEETGPAGRRAWHRETGAATCGEHSLPQQAVRDLSSTAAASEELAATQPQGTMN